MLKPLFVGIFAICIPTVCVGDVVPWLYEVTLPVASQTVNEVNRANRIGLVTVLERVTGQREIERLQSIRAALQNAQNFVLQHSFGIGGIDPDTDEEIQLATIEYDPVAIKNVVRSVRLPLWTANRPTILIWLSHVDNGSFRFVEDKLQPESTLVQTLQDTARARGLEIRWGRNATPDYGVYNFTNHLLAQNREFRFLASDSSADVVLAINLIPFRSHFLLQGSIPFGVPMKPVWSGIFDTEEEAVAAAFHVLADQLVDLYGVESSSTYQFEILVDNIESIEVYLAVVQYLNSWEFVDRVDLTFVRGTSFRFMVYSSSSSAQFLTHVQDDGQLEPVSTEAPTETAIKLTYKGS